jgi:chromosome segregation ATPase|eukprot:g1066.t1
MPRAKGRKLGKGGKVVHTTHGSNDGGDDEQAPMEQDVRTRGELSILERRGLPEIEDTFSAAAQEYYTAAYEITLDLINNPLTEHLAHIRTVAKGSVSNHRTPGKAEKGECAEGVNQDKDRHDEKKEELGRTEKQLTSHQLKRRAILVNSLREYMKRQCDLVETQRQQYTQHLLHAETRSKMKSDETKVRIEGATKKHEALLRECNAEKQGLKKTILDLEEKLQEMEFRHRHDVAEKVSLLKLQWEKNLEALKISNVTKAELKRFQTMHFQHEQTLSLLMTQKRQAKDSCIKMEQVLQSLVREKHYLTRCLHDGVAKNTQQELALAENETRIKLMTERMGELKTTNKGLERELTASRRELEKLSEAQTKSRVDRTKLGLENGSLKSKVEELQKQIGAAKEQSRIRMEESNQNKVSFGKQIIDQKNEIVRLQMEVEKGKDSTQQAEAKSTATLKEKLRELDSHLDGCRLENTTLQNTLHNRDIELTNLRDTYMSEKNIRQEKFGELRKMCTVLLATSRQNGQHLAQVQNNYNRKVQNVRQLNRTFEDLNVQHKLLHNNFKHAMAVSNMNKESEQKKEKEEHRLKEEENNRLMEMLSSPSKRITEAEEKMNSLAMENNAKEKAIKRMQDEAVVVQRELSFLQQDVGNYKQTIRQQKETISRLEIESLKFKSDHEKSKFAASVAEQTNKDIQRRFEKEKELLQLEHTSRQKAIQHELDLVTGDVSMLENKLAKARKLYRERLGEDGVADLGDGVHVPYKTLCKQVAEMKSAALQQNEKMQALVAEKLSVEQTLNNVSHELTSAQIMITKSQEMEQSSKDMIKVLETAQEKLLHDFQKTRKKLKVANEEKSKAVKEYRETIERERQALREMLEEKDALLAKVEKDREDSLNEIIMKMNRKEKELDAVKRANERLNGQVSAFQSGEVRARSSNETKLKIVNDAMKKDTENREKRMQELQFRLKNKENEVKQLQDVRVILQNQVKELKDAERRILTEKEAMDTEKDSLNVQLTGAVSELQGMQQMVCSWENKWQRMQKEFDALQGREAYTKDMAKKLRQWSRKANGLAKRLKVEAR